MRNDFHEESAFLPVETGKVAKSVPYGLPRYDEGRWNQLLRPFFLAKQCS